MSTQYEVSNFLTEWANDGTTEEEESNVQSSLFLSEPTNVPIEPVTQMDKVMKLFYTQRDVCHSDFMEHYIPRFGALIWTLRHEHDWVIDKERCDEPLHNHQSPQYKYVFKGVKDV